MCITQIIPDDPEIKRLSMRGRRRAPRAGAALCPLMAVACRSSAGSAPHCCAGVCLALQADRLPRPRSHPARRAGARPRCCRTPALRPRRSSACPRGHRELTSRMPASHAPAAPPPVAGYHRPAPPVAASPNHAAASPAAPAAAPCRLLRPTSDRRAFPGPLSPLHQLRGPAPPPARRLGQLAVRRLRPRARPWRRLLCVPRRLRVAAPRAAASRLRPAPSGLAGFRSPGRCRASGRLRLAAAPGRLLQHPAAGSLAPPPPALSLSGLHRSLPAP